MDSLETMDRETLESFAKVQLALANNPNTRAKLFGLMKEADPNVIIPEYDEVQKIKAEFDARDKEIQALKDKLAEDEMKRNILAQRQTLMQEKGYTQEDIDAIEKLAMEQGIAKYETAADYYDLQKQTAVPTPAASGNAFQRPSLPEGVTNMKEWARQEAAKTFTEMRQRRF